MTNSVKQHPGDWKQTKGSICWESPANIALIKYWGKFPGQLPMNPSLSFGLKNSTVEIKLDFELDQDQVYSLESFRLNGIEHHGFRSRIDGFLRDMTSEFPFLAHAHITISSKTTFPHSAGIASSAAAFSALALCLCSVEEIIFQQTIDSRHFFRKASHISRMGSGSASRSVYDGLVLWGRTKLIAESSDEYAVRLPDSEISHVFSHWKDAVLIADSSSKKVSSSKGHALMDTHAYRQARVQQSAINLESILAALRNGDVHKAGEVIENEALSLHSLMMSSRPGYVLMKPATLKMLEIIWDFRSQTNIPVYVTLDAGPNIHLLYMSGDEQQVYNLIRNELSLHCQDGKWIDDLMGHGPVRKDSHS